MSHFTLDLVIEAKLESVYAALTTPEGLQGWWTEDCDVDSHVGGDIHLRFGPNRKDMQIKALVPHRRVHWLCTGAHIAVADLRRRDEWVGTQLVFELAAEGAGRTRLHFEHFGLVPSFECYGLCSDGWRYYLASLQQFAETGVGTPRERAVALA